MSNKAFKRYAEIKAQMKVLEEEGKKISESLVADLVEAGTKQIKNTFGTFSLIERKVWTYSNHVKKLKERLQYQESLEQLNKVATFTTNKSIMYNQPPR